MLGNIFDIQKFCINDGPGIRTTVFFKGCPLRCEWCHNPESNRIKPELLFMAEKCIGCEECAAVCESFVHIFDEEHIVLRDKCVSCKKCETVCPVKALEIAGKSVSADEIIKIIMSDKEFYEDSGGGLTISGGEPFMQYGFMLEILKKAKENGLHTCVETCGYTDEEKLLEAAEYIDIFLFDYKLTEADLHKKYTGVDNTKILENLKALDENGSKIILRCPIIPSVNDNEGHFRGIAATADSLRNVIGIEIAPYHELGISKSERLGQENIISFRPPEKEEFDSYIACVKKYTSVPVKKM
ncbi:MAG: glycyl-radical enzyme activating protein [Ruminococcaceae bacterium]|nr:glycyl-radical enzyme activating protein [Oscillospiraceae bacterium]MBR3597939.1 glycyl-radical enzyme activating protein [Clostridia bacterium]